MAKKSYVLLFLMISLLACQETKSTKEKVPTGDSKTKENLTDLMNSISTPDGYKILGEATGSLDQDSIPERVIVYDTDQQSDFGTARTMHIYRKENNRWNLWHKTNGALLASEGGGVFGDPFQSVSIEKKCILIEHFGGSRQKWNYKHRFRYQNNDWQLIGATVVYGAPCDTWEDFDYNLSTGKAHYQRKTENCDEGEIVESKIIINKSIEKKLDNLPSMDDFAPGENQIQLFDNGVDFYY